MARASDAGIVIVGGGFTGAAVAYHLASRLPALDERRRLVRRPRASWDVHRFRVAPQVEAVLDRRAAAGSFQHLAARLVSSRVSADGQVVAFRRRGTSEVEECVFEVVVNTTGPSPLPASA